MGHWEGLNYANGDVHGGRWVSDEEELQMEIDRRIETERYKKASLEEEKSAERARWERRMDEESDKALRDRQIREENERNWAAHRAYEEEQKEHERRQAQSLHDIEMYRARIRYKNLSFLGKLVNFMQRPNKLDMANMTTEEIQELYQEDKNERSR